MPATGDRLASQINWTPPAGRSRDRDPLRRHSPRTAQHRPFSSAEPRDIDRAADHPVRDIDAVSAGTEADRRAPHVDPDQPKTAPNFAQSRGRKWQRSTSRIIDPSAPREQHKHGEQHKHQGLFPALISFTAFSRPCRTRSSSPSTPKAMPVVLTTDEEHHAWMRAARDEALQRPYPTTRLRSSRRRQQGRSRNGSIRSLAPVFNKPTDVQRHQSRVPGRLGIAARHPFIRLRLHHASAKPRT
jgi:hypothetical protein